MKIALLISCTLCLMGCEWFTYALINQDGVVARHLYLSDCERLNEKYKLDGVCVRE